jgi:hypothetical protein
MPSAITSLVWNFDHGNRSIRAGIRLRMLGLLVVVSDVVAMCSPSNILAAASTSGRPGWGGYPEVSCAHLMTARKVNAVS